MEWRLQQHQKQVNYQETNDSKMPPTERTNLLPDDPLATSPTGMNTNNNNNTSNSGGSKPTAQQNQRHEESSPSSFIPTPKKKFRKQDVIYDGDNHLQVLLQMYGSVWPAVFPWCIATLIVTYIIIYLRNHDIADLTTKNATGHNFMSMLVSFLIVTRATITYNRFMEARAHLSDMYRSAREIVQYTCILTIPNKNEEAKQWRQQIAFQTIICLRTAMAAMEYRSQGINAWDVIEDEEHEQMELLLPPSDQNQQRKSSYKPRSNHSDFLRSMAHGPRTLQDENFRAPIVWSYNLRECVLKTRADPTILGSRPLHVNEELKILSFVSNFVTAFHGHRKLISTPFPFPMVQMTRTFLFFWVFSLPMVLIPNNDSAIEVLVLMFFCTYGFLGLEYVAVELDDPYGDDPNDFPGQRWAELVFEDIYISIYKTDGYPSATQLRSRVTDRMASGNALNLYRRDLFK